jgi:drug/metabolite transporter (DMT)-like permease
MVYGVAFSFLASVCYSIANLMEKSAVDRMPTISARRTGHMLRQLCSSRLWVSGFLIGVAAVLLTVLAYSLAPIVIVQTIVGAGLALLVLGSRLYLHEPIGQREYVGLGLIIVAVILVSATLTSGATHDARHSTFDVLVASAVTAIVAIVAFMAARRSRGADASLRFGLTSGLFYGVAGLQAKGAASLLARHGLVDGAGRVMASAYPYLFILTSVLGLMIFQSGLQRCRIGVVGPLASMVSSIYVVVVGMLVFHEALPADPTHILMRVLGFVLALGAGGCFATGPGLPLVHALGDAPQQANGS